MTELASRLNSEGENRGKMGRSLVTTDDSVAVGGIGNLARVDWTIGRK